MVGETKAAAVGFVSGETDGVDWIWEGEGGGGDWEKGARVSCVDEGVRG